MAELLPGLVCALLQPGLVYDLDVALGPKKWSHYPTHPPCIHQAWPIRLVFCPGWVSVPVAVRAGLCSPLVDGGTLGPL